MFLAYCIVSGKEEKTMPGKFCGLTDAVWAIIEPLLPAVPAKPGRGRPHAPFRDILNTIIWVLITGARWADVPEENGFGSRSTSHRQLGIWESDGTWENIKARLTGKAYDLGLIDWERSSVDGSFVAGKGGGDDVEYGFKGKGVTVHALVDNNGNPLSVISTGAAEGERAQIEPLIEQAKVLTGKPGRPKKLPGSLQADKGYDSRKLRDDLGKRGITPMIDRRTWPDRKPPIGRPPARPVDRWKIERTFAWFQRKYRRLSVRWERRNKYWKGFIIVAVCLFWVNLLI
jgi:transposase